MKLSGYPFFSIILPTYNRSDFVVDAIESVINQSFSDFELLVIDDGSIDKTKSVVEGYCVKDKRVKYYYQDNSGVSIARNTGIKMATGKYICYLDSDDIWSSKKLNEIHKVCTQGINVDVIFHDFVKHDVRLPEAYNKTNTDIFPYILDIFNELSPDVWIGSIENSFDLMLRGYPIYPSSMCVRAGVHDNFRWDPLVLKSEDFNLFIKLSMMYPFTYINKVLAVVRVHGDNKSDDLLTKNRVELGTIKMVQQLYCDDSCNKKVSIYLLKFYYWRGFAHIKRGEYKRGVTLLIKALINPNLYIRKLKKLIFNND